MCEIKRVIFLWPVFLVLNLSSNLHNMPWWWIHAPAPHCHGWPEGPKNLHEDPEFRHLLNRCWFCKVRKGSKSALCITWKRRAVEGLGLYRDQKKFRNVRLYFKYISILPWSYRLTRSNWHRASGFSLSWSAIKRLTRLAEPWNNNITESKKTLKNPVTDLSLQSTEVLLLVVPHDLCILQPVK